jgi:hypothetical protein
MDTLTMAIRSDNIQIIMTECGLNGSLLGSNEGMAALIKGFIEKYSKK